MFLVPDAQCVADVADRWAAAMLRGDFEAAWRETDRIERLRRAGQRVEGALLWDGSDFSGRTVLLESDHGLGDAIQFLRYGALLRPRCDRVIVRAQEVLHPLLRLCPWIDDVIMPGSPSPPHDVAIGCMELPYVFRTTLDTIPAHVPYLAAPQAPPPTCHGAAFHVGLCWASGPYNARRSLPLAALDPLAEIPGVVFHTLQWGDPAREVWNGHRLPFCAREMPVDLLHMAHCIAHMALVISVDTMAAHLAGALARPTWVLLLKEADWRWMQDRTDSPWYPTMRLFRQRERCDWAEPVAAVARELCRLVQQQATPALSGGRSR